LTGDVFRVSDDGEPSGTAGRPILGQIDSRGITDTAIIVVRYFGGTLLGVPGLIHAYKTAAALVLQTTPVIQKPIEVVYSLQFDYTIINDVMNVIKQSNSSILEKDMNLFCRLIVGIQKSRLEEVLYRLGELRTVEVDRKS
jgi:putative IMPACT (imprinted ancient) family translation regulator